MISQLIYKIKSGLRYLVVLNFQEHPKLVLDIKVIILGYIQYIHYLTVYCRKLFYFLNNKYIKK